MMLLVIGYKRSEKSNIKTPKKVIKEELMNSLMESKNEDNTALDKEESE